MMKTFSKDASKDFVVLNLSDPQMGDENWGENSPHQAILEHTIRELVSRVHPDLITITGDVAWAEHYASYENLANLLDSTGIPWAPVWGNHDHQCGEGPLKKAADLLKAHPLCLLEDGDPAMGFSNYILTITENGQPVTALFMVDSHNSTEVEENGEKRWAYDKLWPTQIDWIDTQATSLKQQGYKDGMMFLHIPLYCYRPAALTVFPGNCDAEAACGVQYEPVFSHPYDEGALDMIHRSGLITHVLAGHDHSNNFMIDYEDIRLMFAAKTGAGCYWNEKLNGGTVIRINSDGIYDAHHEFVNVAHITEGKGIPEFKYDWNK